jgi:hypothetical protein
MPQSFGSRWSTPHRASLSATGIENYLNARVGALNDSGPDGCAF